MKPMVIRLDGATTASAPKTDEGTMAGAPTMALAASVERLRNSRREMDGFGFIVLKSVPQFRCRETWLRLSRNSARRQRQPGLPASEAMLRNLHDSPCRDPRDSSKATACRLPCR